MVQKTDFHPKKWKPTHMSVDYSVIFYNCMFLKDEWNKRVVETPNRESQNVKKA